MITNTNSAEQEIDLSFLTKTSTRLWVKRDDLIHPFISGNKWRKLEGIIELALQSKIQTIETSGGPFSNHLLATACAGAHYGLNTIGIVRGEPVKNHVLLLCQQFGMSLQFVDRTQMRQRRQEKTELEISGPKMIIPEGGNCEEAWKGCQKILTENELEYDEIWLAVGTGTTITGMSKAVKPAKLHGVMVVNDHALAEQLENSGINIYRQYARGGYARMDSELTEATKTFTSRTGILLDPVYTGKLWMALKDRIGAAESAKRILMIHSGGLSGWLSEGALKLMK